MDNTMMIAITEIRATMGERGDAALEGRIKLAMQSVQGHWLVHDEERRFKVAIGAVLMEATPEEEEQIKAELRVLQTLSAAISGVPVNMGVALDGFDGDKAIGIGKLWKDIAQQK